MPRLFRCRHCRHRLRFGATRCGFCWVAVPFWNRTGTFVFLFGLFLVGVVAIILGNTM